MGRGYGYRWYYSWSLSLLWPGDVIVNVKHARGGDACVGSPICRVFPPLFTPQVDTFVHILMENESHGRMLVLAYAIDCSVPDTPVCAMDDLLIRCSSHGSLLPVVARDLATISLLTFSHTR